MSAVVMQNKIGAPYYFATLHQKIAAMKAEGQDIIRLDIGSPDLPPAPPIIEALCRAAAMPDRHGYQDHKGPPALREAWAEMYRRVFGVVLDPEIEIIPLLGSKEGIFHIALALLRPGDLVLIPNPCYPTYTQGTQFAGVEPYFMPLRAENRFLPDFDAIPSAVARQARLMWLNYPNNPTGATASLDFFERAVVFARQHDILLCHDAAYTQVTDGDYRAPSLLEVPGAREVAVEFNSLSKSHNMAGWRVGAAIGNPQALQMLYTLKTNLDSSHFLPILEAATLAMTGDQSWLQSQNELYRQRREAVVEALHVLGLPVQKTPASLYVWSPVPEGYSSMDFAGKLLDQAGVSLAPGSMFGSQGEGYARISLVAPWARLTEAMKRLSTWWKDVGARYGDGA
jgi:LL-diaminopimelate aminotransferase